MGERENRDYAIIAVAVCGNNLLLRHCGLDPQSPYAKRLFLLNTIFFLWMISNLIFYFFAMFFSFKETFCFAKALRLFWIPACAGMTKGGGGND
jgi:hypothetical protein